MLLLLENVLYIALFNINSEANNNSKDHPASIIKKKLLTDNYGQMVNYVSKQYRGELVSNR